MNISMPFGLIGGILKWFWNKITRFWLYKTYKKSHEYKLKQLRLGSFWEKLDNNLEYSIRFATAADCEALKSEIAFRTREGTLKSVTLILEASGCGVRYQQKIELVNLDENTIVVSLDQIPRLDVIKVTDDGIFFSINKTRFINCEVVEDDGYQCKPFDSRISYLMHNWLLNDKWERRWGTIWNCNAIEHAKYEISVYWRLKLGGNNHYSSFLSSARRFSIQYQAQNLLCKILVKPYMLTLQFWLVIHLGFFRLGDGTLIHKKNQN